MSSPLRKSLADAERLLPAEDQEMLAAMIDSYLSNLETLVDEVFSKEEQEDIGRIAREPRTVADAADIDKLFAKYDV